MKNQIDPSKTRQDRREAAKANLAANPARKAALIARARQSEDPEALHVTAADRRLATAELLITRATKRLDQGRTGEALALALRSYELYIQA